MTESTSEAFPHPWKVKTRNYAETLMSLILWLGTLSVACMFAYTIMFIGIDSFELSVLIFWSSFIVFLAVISVLTFILICVDILIDRRTKNTHVSSSIVAPRIHMFWR
jgi:hypothetical protein